MKRKLIFITIAILSWSGNLFAQNETIFCKGKGYKGYIFDSSYTMLKSIKDQKGKSSLSCKEIAETEMILKIELPSLNISKINQQKGCPNISKKLSKYCRQYFGFVNVKGEKIIWINMFWNKSLNDRAKNELISVNDGCSYYWNVEVNITNRTLLNLQVNGKG